MTWQEMNEFLSVATELIKHKGFASTVGHRFFSDVVNNDSSESFVVSVDKPQFHYYAKSLAGFGDPFQIEGQGLFSGNPKPFLGEFDSDLNRFGWSWPELAAHAGSRGTAYFAGKDTTLNRLNLLEKEGCELALIWGDLDDSDKKDPIKLQQVTRQAIIDFTGGKLPDKPDS